MRRKLHTFFFFVSLIGEESKCGCLLLLLIDRGAWQGLRSWRHRRVFSRSQTYRRGRWPFFVRHTASRTYSVTKISPKYSKVLLARSDTKNSGTENMRITSESSYFHLQRKGSRFTVMARRCNQPSHSTRGKGLETISSHINQSKQIKTFASFLISSGLFPGECLILAAGFKRNFMRK